MKKRWGSTKVVEKAIREAFRDPLAVPGRRREEARDPLPPLPPEESPFDLVRRRYEETGRFLPGTPKRLIAQVLKDSK